MQHTVHSSIHRCVYACAGKPTPKCFPFAWHNPERLSIDIKHVPAGTHTGDLEIQYELGNLVYASLTGHCAEVNVQLSQEVITLQPTYINTQSQRSFR